MHVRCGVLERVHEPAQEEKGSRSLGSHSSAATVHRTLKISLNFTLAHNFPLTRTITYHFLGVGSPHEKIPGLWRPQQAADLW